MTKVVDVSIKVDPVMGHDLGEDGKLADMSVLNLDVTEATATLLVSTFEHTEEIKEEEAKRVLVSELGIESVGGG